MSAGYHHLAHCERCQIRALLHRGLSKREISREFGWDSDTISRALSHNRGQRGYRHKQAHGKALSRHRGASAVTEAVTRRMVSLCAVDGTAVPLTDLQGIADMIRIAYHIRS